MEAIEVPSKHGLHPVYIYRTEDGDVIEWTFQKRRAGGGGFYECCACKKLRTLPDHRGKRTPRAQIVDGKFVTDPVNPEHAHFCRFQRIGGALGRRELYKLAQKVRRSRPFNGSYRTEFHAALNNVQKEAATTYDLDGTQTKEMQAAIVGNGGFESKVSALRKAGQAARQRDARARRVEETGGLTLNGQRFLQSANVAGDIYIFCNSSLISKAFGRGCRVVADDASYELGCQEHGLGGQLYSLLMMDAHSAYPIVYMITRSCSENAYKLMFRVFRELIDAEGQAQFLPELKFILESEKPYVSACRQIFPECAVQACSFQFTQALNRKWHCLTRSLQPPEDVQEWFTQFKGLMYLPVALAQDYFSESLQFPPDTVATDAELRKACLAFIEYVREAWIEHPHFKQIWENWMVFNERKVDCCIRRHNELKAFVKESKPTLLKLIEALVEEENITRHSLIDKFINQQFPSPYCRQVKKRANEDEADEETAAVQPNMQTRNVEEVVLKTRGDPDGHECSTSPIQEKSSFDFVIADSAV
ncbi:hypothetical protein Tcan_14379 [Toxocara canis]|uniref:MULE transposase domain-containing protein n=1 Tax=Toxocara canis TaxID=6265 RepID=A0A0B2W5J3_TOXCA|nr:hypothetical protein Tcan_14379 [Toxocara canis]